MAVRTQNVHRRFSGLRIHVGINDPALIVSDRNDQIERAHIGQSSWIDMLVRPFEGANTMATPTLKFAGEQDEAASNSDALPGKVRSVSFSQDDLSHVIDVEDGRTYPVREGKSIAGIITLVALLVTVMATPGTLSAGERDREIVENTLLDLRTRTTWIESYQRGGFDCSVQSTTLWHILAERGVRTRVAYSVYFDRTLNLQMDHVFLLAALDGVPMAIDATTLELLDANVSQRGYFIVRVWNNPDEANAEWPGEYIRWDVNRLRKSTSPSGAR